MLVKLTILPFDDSETIQRGSPSGPPFTAQINPETYSDTTEVLLAPTEPAHGDSGQEAKFKAESPKELSLEFVIDGTGVIPVPPLAGDANSPASGSGTSVVGQIKHFRRTTGFTGEVHRPRFLMLIWGKLTLVCVLKSFTITYKLFTPEGLPLRALLSATFVEHKDPEKAELEKNLASPDIEHAHLIDDTDILPSIVDRIYRSPRHYVSVAEVNGLNSVRRLPSGSILHLPPLR